MASTAFQTLTIANGATTSDACSVADYAAFGLQMPAAFTGTAITFTVSTALAGTYTPLSEYNTLTNDGTATRAVALTVAASTAYPLPDALTAWPFFKVVSGSAEGASRSLIITKKRP